MASRQQLLSRLDDQRPSPGRRPKPTAEGGGGSSMYTPEHRAKAYAAFLDGLSWADCARAMGHHDPTKSGAALVRKWAEEDKWTRHSELTYKDKVEKERAADPVRISNDIDGLCVKMQQVAQNYIEQFFDPESHRVEIPNSFKTRDFADMAAALRMIHETRIKIRKANEPEKGKGDGKKTDFLTMIRRAGQARLDDNRRRRNIKPSSAVVDESDMPQDGDEPPDDGDDARGEAALPTLSHLRSQLESAMEPETRPDGPQDDDHADA